MPGSRVGRGTIGKGPTMRVSCPHCNRWNTIQRYGHAPDCRWEAAYKRVEAALGLDPTIGDNREAMERLVDTAGPSAILAASTRDIRDVAAAF